MSKKNTDSEFSAGIRAGLEEAIAFTEGKSKKARRVQLEFVPVPNYTANRISKLRKKHKLTREVMAALMSISPETIKSWENGTNKPSGSNARMLQILETNPDLLMESLKKHAI